MTDSVALCFAAEHVPVTRACHELEHLKLFMMTGLSAQAATEVRKEVNKLDNQTTGKAIDALLNFETVALFNNQVPQPPPEHLGLYTFPPYALYPISQILCASLQSRSLCNFSLNTLNAVVLNDLQPSWAGISARHAHTLNAVPWGGRRWRWRSTTSCCRASSGPASRRRSSARRSTRGSPSCWPAA